ncbi:MAG: SOS response-associated peptidase [Chitinophagaceae bacterium]|nr:SOS response-associated peptidase [Chitinophagaceae bacterium]
MCYHNTLKKKAKSIVDYYEVAFDQEELFHEIYHGNAFTFPTWPIVSMNDGGKIKLKNWGLIPSWVKTIDDAKKYRSFNLNAKSETAFDKPSFRNAVRSQRCLVPSTGFFEWREYGKKKYPYWIGLKERDLFSMAGISEKWVNSQTGELVETFSILTTEANSLMAEIHNSKKRMPVILNREDEQRWLSPELSESEVHQLCLPFGQEAMIYHTVSPLITSRTTNSNTMEVAEDFTYPELPILKS